MPESTCKGTILLFCIHSPEFLLKNCSPPLSGMQSDSLHPRQKQHEIVVSCRVKQGFRDCVSSTSITQIFLGLHA
ncbi:hypothetical protein ATANTOWER_006822 [Ataeniobius toweri]|uniref:Uncharacterized protein n=1 Tax=Ataeniobius toweri TaxID=208326 RepID=A0ABU7BMS5_9TELE|nr:hypothetical protein [Ataeniobius toweri]